jgi:hypothetical protein
LKRQLAHLFFVALTRFVGFNTQIAHGEQQQRTNVLEKGE